MNPIEINLSLAPGARVVVNGLYPSREPGFLVDDLLLVELPGYTFIDVSWSPEMDPDGSFWVTVFRGEWENRLLEIPLDSPLDAARMVEDLARIYTAPIEPVSCSTGQTTRLDLSAA